MCRETLEDKQTDIYYMWILPFHIKIFLVYIYLNKYIYLYNKYNVNIYFNGKTKVNLKMLQWKQNLNL